MEDKEIDKKKREEFVIKVGPEFKKILDKQKEIIDEATWNCVTASAYEIGEILAKKMKEKGLI